MASSELVILLPLLVALVFAVIEFSLLEVGRQRVMNSARQGAGGVAAGGDVSRRRPGGGVWHRRGPVGQHAAHRVRGRHNTGDPVVVRVSVMMKAAAPTCSASSVTASARAYSSARA